MEDFIEFKEPLTYKNTAKDVFNMYGSLMELYMKLMNLYNELNNALDEAALSKDVDLETYSIACLKLNHLSVAIPDLLEEEKEIFINNEDLLPFLETYIKKRFKLKVKSSINRISIINTYFNSHYKNLKGNYSILRMIRAMAFYRNYSDAYYEYLTYDPVDIDDDVIKSMMTTFDYPDIEMINTLITLDKTYDQEGERIFYNKYKCLFMFTSPTLENMFLDFDFDRELPFFKCNFDEGSLKQVKSNIVKAMVAIHKNKIINHKDNNKILNNNLTFKQVMDIIFHFKKVNKNYDNIIDMLKNDFKDNSEEIILLSAYLEQAYTNLDEQSINDLDHLFSVMSSEGNITYGNVHLIKKVVDYFFNKEEILENNGFQRTRKKEDNK